jgi:hypothetical protein
MLDRKFPRLRDSARISVGQSSTYANGQDRRCGKCYAYIEYFVCKTSYSFSWRLSFSHLIS